MNATKSALKPGENTWLWLLKMLSGLLIFVILIIHLLVNHFLAPGGLLDHAGVLAYFTDYPIVPIMEGFFLIFVIAHSLLGTRSIILDLKPSQGVMRLVDAGLLLLGVVSSVYGIWLLFAILAQA